MSKDTEFTIALPDGKDEHNISKLIGWALKELPEHSDQNFVTISEFYLDPPFSKNDKPTINVKYDIMGDEFVELRNHNMAWRQEESVAEELPEFEYGVDPQTKPQFNYFIRRMPAGTLQDDGIKLVSKVAEDVRTLEGRVLDLIYHDFLDEDALGRPYIIVYFHPI
ncbi:MAG: hypothetical protein ACQR33_04445 [Candidatus Saccharibacteria bacterium]